MKNLTKDQETALFGPEDHEGKVVHTPGPWRIGRYAVNDYDNCVYAVDQEDKIATVETWKGEAKRESEANALLITAAPDLLDALKTAQVRIFMLEGSSGEYEKAGKAIDKATGRNT